METEMQSLVEDHIQSRSSKLRKNKKYSKLNISFYNNYDYLYHKLDKEDRKTFEDTFDFLFDLHSQENYFTYQLGFTDGIKLDKELSKNKVDRKTS